MAGSHGLFFTTANARLRGSAFSLDDAKLLMYAWTARQRRYILRSLSVTFIADSNATLNAVNDVLISFAETLKFDMCSGQQGHPEKIQGWSNRRDSQRDTQGIIVEQQQ